MRKAGGAPPSQWFPLTSTDPVPISVRPVAEAPPSAVPLDVPDFARAVTAGDALLGSTEPDDVPFGWLIAGMLVPPLAFLVVRGTHRQNRSRRRSKAGRDALRALARGREPHVVIREYANDSTDERVGEFLHLCDAVRFGGASADLRSLADKLVRDREAEG